MPVAHPRLELTPVPLDSRRAYALKVAGLQKGMTFRSFNLNVHTRPGKAFRNWLSNASGKPDHPVIRIRLLDQEHRQFLTQTIGSQEQPWDSRPAKRGAPVLTSHVSGGEDHPARPRQPESEFTIIVEILQPSEIPGRFLQISTGW
jgi:hypothetical protein